MLALLLCFVLYIYSLDESLFKIPQWTNRKKKEM